ncbi:hypothetical protein [Mycobacterium sp. ACS4054]|uniref:hypothetical protein n=1 Tax=Mycobacterium sp. ACS4054 TaxID=1834119 RepID=UPI0012EA2CA6|nr:hypothetical protein [Mycobacterium sp. ACS4054]
MTTIACLQRAMTITKLAAIASATVAATIGMAGAAHADDSYDFQSPSGNIGCSLNTHGASCEVLNYTWFIPRPPDYQMGGRGNIFVLGAGSAPVAGVWHSDHQFPDGSPTLNYGHRALPARSRAIARAQA